ncbi:MAG: hypothetical protein MJZ26_02135 [Fibrobacter sp.]|nr:hypothetical protein [Fibrobacter sp.]
MNKILSLCSLLVACVFSSALAHVERMPDMKDKRDGRVYKTVQIGDQRWMAENLRYDLKGSFCYENKPVNCERFGRLYNWSMAMMLVDFYNNHTIAKLVPKYREGRIHDICPKGWHLPTNKDWKRMKNFVGKKGSSDGVGISLKSVDFWEKEIRLPGGNDEFGFNALPSGERDFEGRYFDMFRSALYWTSTEYDDGGAYIWWIYYDSRSMEKNYDTKETAASVRCVEDVTYKIKEPPPPPRKIIPKVVEVQGKKLQTIHIGDQVWMANNVDTKVPGSFCYQDKEEYCEKYGRLYTWSAALKLDEKFQKEVARDSISKIRPKGICPNGWHVPTARDYYRLNVYLKEIDDAVGVGTNLKSRTGWNESENALLGENGFGFNAEAFGIRRYALPKMLCERIVKDILKPTKKGMEPDTVYADSCVVDPQWQPGLVYEGDSLFTGFWSGTESDSLSSVVWKLTYDEDDFVQDSASKDEAYYLRCMMDPPEEDEIYDSTAIHDRRDDNKYKTVVIGEDTWMAENLRFAAPGSYCYEEKDSRCRSYGRLYPWTVAMRLPADYIDNSSTGGIMIEHQGLCPDGWHVPTNEEWLALGQKALNMRRGGIGAAMKSKEGWARGGAPISAASGFNALPSGSRFADGEYLELGSSAYFWTAAGGDGMGGVYWYLVNNKDEFTSAEDFDNASFSLRCVKNKLSKDSGSAPAAAP